MKKTKNHVLASELLASVALGAHRILRPIAQESQSASASQIATLLYCIDGLLSTQELDELPHDTQDLCSDALRVLMRVCEWPTISDPGSLPKLRDSLVEIFRIRKLEVRAQKSITAFCKQRPDAIEHFQLPFRKLRDQLEKDVQESRDPNPPHSRLKPEARHLYPDTVHQLLLDGVKVYASCTQEAHENAESKEPVENTWHLTKLCLNSGVRSDDQRALFDIVTASFDMTYWQETTISVPIKDIELNNTPGIPQSHESAANHSESSLVKVGDVCKWLESPNYAIINLDLAEDCTIHRQTRPEMLEHCISGSSVRLSELLEKNELTVKHKIILSYAVARAFWQFYNSELMEARWTSEDICFVPLNETISKAEGVPLRAFVSFPFGSQYRSSPAESDDGQGTHRYPRILFLGIVLLEIGLGQTIGGKLDAKLSPLAYTNTAHYRAKKRLEELKEAEWVKFKSKPYFIEAIENCLDSVKFKGSPDAKASSLSARRDALFKNVVAPLKWLATVGFEDSQQVVVIPTRRKLQRKETLTAGPVAKFSWKTDATASLLSGSPSNREDFFKRFQEIAKHILCSREDADVEKPIRVAILDTGCNMDLPFFRKSQRSERLKGWKDFTAAGSKSATDTFGHGTYMTRLLMHVAPIVDIYLIRVAENTEDLENNKDNIAKAIEHAGLDPEWHADIISMSFGLPNKPDQTYPTISDAIEKVTKNRDNSVTFLASAGNSWEARQCFPGSHPEVIPIYAANSTGEFLPSNPAHSKPEYRKLGTYGTDIPSHIIEELLRFFPEADLTAGTSIATAIAAGTVAMVLSYAAALPSLLRYKGAEEFCERLRTRRVMRQMLYAMSLKTGHDEHFINPVWFWGEKDQAKLFLQSVCSAIDTVNRET